MAWEFEISRHHTDDHRAGIAEYGADYIGVAAEAFLPEAIAEDDCIVGFDEAVFFVKRAAQQRAGVQRVKEICRHKRAGKRLRVFDARQAGAAAGDSPELP